MWQIAAVRRSRKASLACSAARCVATNVELDVTPPSDPEGSAVIAAARAVWGDELVGVTEVD
jgi:hypothetical protein